MARQFGIMLRYDECSVPSKEVRDCIICIRRWRWTLRRNASISVTRTMPKEFGTSRDRMPVAFGVLQFIKRWGGEALTLTRAGEVGTEFFYLLGRAYRRLY